MFLILYLKRCYILQIPNNELESICKLPSLLLRLSKLSPLLQSSRKGKVFINWLIYTFFTTLLTWELLSVFTPLSVILRKNTTQDLESFSTAFCSGCLCIQGTTITELKSQAQAFLVRIVGLNVVVATFLSSYTTKKEMQCSDVAALLTSIVLIHCTAISGSVRSFPRAFWTVVLLLVFSPSPWARANFDPVMLICYWKRQGKIFLDLITALNTFF